MHRVVWSIAILSLVCLPVSAGVPERVTFSKDVLPILQENCQSCHRPAGANLAGMIAPMSLMTYQEVRPWVKSIARAIKTKEMPPWHASEATHGHFKNERTLSADEIGIIVKWAESGARRGNPGDAPDPVEFSATGWNLGTPDLVVAFDEPYFLEDEVEDLYHNVTVKVSEADLPNDRWIRVVEFKPGSEVVHHIIGYASGSGDAAGASAEEGEQTRGMIGGIAPGTDPDEFPEGTGVLLPKGATVIFAMHYHKESGPGTGQWDKSAMGFAFHEKPVTHPVELSTISYGPFEIPPGHSNWRVGASRTFDEDTLLLAMLPHLHLRGKAARYTAYYPDGTEEVLLDVPHYDFNWQTSYKYAENKLLPAGTRIEMDLYYDNSDEQAAQIGFNSQRAVRFGGPTTDEMDLAWITITPAAPVDALAGAGGR